jgi:hypothetical protein
MRSPFSKEDDMGWLPILAVVLLLFWVAGEAMGFALGAALNLFWILALVLLVVWVFQRIL